ncbi:hypothetical protein, partial [Deinococcus saxicola]|uniref:hypothetical protein n=1 Tax=Deinococcus saxicola TaxID=249406 RepID=UPI003D098151
DMIMQKQYVIEKITIAAGADDALKYFNLLCESHFFEIESLTDGYVLIEDHEKRQRHFKLLQRKKIEGEILCRISRPYWSWFQFDDESAMHTTNE